MAIFKKTKHIKVPELVCMYPWGNSAAGASVSGDYLPQYFPRNNTYWYWYSSTVLTNFSIDESVAGTQVNPGSGGTFGSGSCSEFRAYCVSSTGAILHSATAGTTNSITTTLTAAINAAGQKVRIAEGPNAGKEYTIKYNTIGTNSTIVFEETAPTAFSTATKFYLITGSVYLFNAGTLSSSSFRVYDIFTNSAYSLSITGLPTAWGTDGQLVSPHVITDNYASGDVTSATTTVLTVSGLNATSNWAKYEVEIVDGTGAGQVRVITASSATTITVGTAFSVTPDATSKYTIKGDRTSLLLLGNGSVTMYKYTIGANTWSTITPTTARASTPTFSFTVDIIRNNPDWVTPLTATGKIGGQNGRYLYSFIGNGSSELDIYDIALNTWTRVSNYGAKSESLQSGSSAVALGKYVYILFGNSRIYKFDTTSNAMEPFYTLEVPQGTVISGDKIWVVPFAHQPYLYSLNHSTNTIMRYAILG